MKIITYNVNGIRAAMNKGFVDWLKATNPDVICLQEIKANVEQIHEAEFTNLGYYCYWYSAQKKGYSGVSILSKQKPKHVEFGCGNELYDNEGRVIRADFENFSVLNAYHPSGSSGDDRQAFKYKWMDFFYDYAHQLVKTHKNLVMCGDYNICHKEIDIHNPKANAQTSGFLPEERAWMEKLISSGFADSFRHFNQEAHQYTWWSYRAGARGKNLGWRIDYNLVSLSLLPKLKRSVILSEAIHSDHCPVLLEIEK